MTNDTIEVVAYRSDWAKFFETETALLEPIFKDAIAIRHVGSTSVPGLTAKPIIDIMVGFAELASVGQIEINQLERNGYEYRGEAGIPGRLFFRKGMPRTHHLHVVKYNSDFWIDHLLFRDYLAAFPETARQYGELKIVLAAKYSRDRERYTDSKGPFICAVLQKARIWREG